MKDQEAWIWHLIEKARRGDEKAVEQLLNEKWIDRQLMLIAAGLRRPGASGGCYEDSKALAQDIRIRVWRGIRGFRGTNLKDFTRWLRAIGKNQVSDYGRSSKRELEVIDRRKPAEDIEYASSQNVFVEVWQKEQRERLRELLDELGPLDRKILNEHLSEKTLDEIGTDLGKPRTTIHRRLTRIQKEITRLRKQRRM